MPIDTTQHDATITLDDTSNEQIIELSEVSEQQLESISGGAVAAKLDPCPYCGSKSVVLHFSGTSSYYECKVCKKTWKAS